jgi:hypothetical protein
MTGRTPVFGRTARSRGLQGPCVRAVRLEGNAPFAWAHGCGHANDGLSGPSERSS